MTEPMRVTGPRATTTPPPPAAAAPTAPPPDPSQVADAAAGDVARLQAARPSALRRATAGDLARAANGVAQAYERAGDAGVHAYLRRNPAALRAFAQATPDAAEAALERAGTSGHVRIALEDHLESVLRSEVASEASAAVRRQLAQLDRTEQQVLDKLGMFRDAPPDSPLGQIAEQLGIRGDEGDAARVRERFAEAREGLQELGRWSQGQAWDLRDFPRTAGAAARERGWVSYGGEDTMIDEIMNDWGWESEAVHIAADITHQVYELAHIAVHAHHHHAAAQAGANWMGRVISVGQGWSVLSGFVGVAVGAYIHHIAEDARAEHIAGVHALGVR